LGGVVFRQYRVVGFIKPPHPLGNMRGFYIGRFQPYHNGHHSMVERISEEVDELVLGIGSADDSHTTHDPFTAGERIMMITKAVAEYDLTTYVVPLEDINRNAVWVSHVESMCPDFDVAYSNNPLVVRLFEESGIEVRQSPMFDRDRLEGSEIRQRMIDDESWRDRVPPSVVNVIEEIHGIKRLQHVSDSDSLERYTATDESVEKSIDDLDD
jgi:nicotinamide-nucleotide adenylyltransferase